MKANTQATEPKQGGRFISGKHPKSKVQDRLQLLLKIGSVFSFLFSKGHHINNYLYVILVIP